MANKDPSEMVKHDHEGAKCLSKLSDKVRRFVLEYLIDYNGKRAVIAAGYSKKNACTMAARLLGKQEVATAICKLQAKDMDRLTLNRDEILLQLYYACTRDAREFVDEEGIIITDPNKLTDRACSVIDGIEQEITEITPEDGPPIRKIRNKLRLMPKLGALEMAMKHKGLFAPTEIKGTIDHSIHFDFDQLYGEPAPDIIDPVQAKLEEALARSIQERDQEGTEQDSSDDDQEDSPPQDLLHHRNGSGLPPGSSDGGG